MAKKNTVKVIRRPLTSDEKTRLEKSRAEAEAQQEEYLARGRQYRARSRAARPAEAVQLADVMKALRSERERQGLSLADMLDKTGMGRGALCSLENAEDPNPTLATVCRVADALGVQLEVRLVTNEPAAARK